MHKKIGVSELKNLASICSETLKELMALGLAPNTVKRATKTYTISKASEMLNTHRRGLYKSMEDLGIDQELVFDEDGEPKLDNTGAQKRAGLSLNSINRIRAHMGIKLRNEGVDKPAVVAIQSFKGGVGKSVTTVYLAQHLAVQGYKVLVIDCDPQGSSTSSFGFVPDNDFRLQDTLHPYLDGKKDSIRYAIRETYFDQVDLVPCCLPFYEVELSLFGAVNTAKTVEERLGYYELFKDAIATVSEEYDVILMDSPPSLSMTSINILIAADIVFVPAPPALYEFASTSQYLEMATRVCESIAPNKEFEIFKILPTKVETWKPRQMNFLDMMRDRFGTFCTTHPFRNIPAIPNAAEEFQTVFDQKRPDTKVAISLNSILEEMEQEIMKMWDRSASSAEQAK